MRHDALSTSPCPIGRSLSVLGERWSLALLREAFMGATRFEDFQSRTQISRNILADRLRTLVDNGVLDRVVYAEHPSRTLYEYQLTEKGRDLYPVMMSLLQWGLEHGHFEPDECDVAVEHVACGHPTRVTIACEHCGQPLEMHDTVVHNAPPALVPAS